MSKHQTTAELQSALARANQRIVELEAALAAMGGNAPVAHDLPASPAEAQRRYDEQLTGVIGIERALAASLDRGLIYEAVKSGILRLFPDVSAIFISGFNAERKVIQALYGFCDDEMVDVANLPELPLAPDGKGMQSKVIYTRQPLIIASEFKKQIRTGVRVGSEGQDTQSALYVPMLAHEAVLGVIQLQSYTPNRFMDEDVRVLSLVANAAAVSLQNTQLYETAQTEIAERKRAEETLRASEERYRMLAENMSDIIWLLDMSLRTVYISPSLTRLRGFTLEEMNELPPDRLTAPESLARAMQAFAEYTAPERLAQTDGPIAIPIDLEYYKKDGSTFWCENTFILIRDANGVPTHILGTGRDITERKQAEEKLRASEQRYRSTLDNMLEGCQILDADWRYLYINEAAARHGHCTREELLNRTMLEIYPGIEDTVMFAGLRDCMNNRVARLLETEFVYPDGARGWFNLSIAPVPEGIFVLSVDVTEQKRARDELARMERRYRAMIENAPDGVVLLDLDGRFKYASPSVERIFGYIQADLPQYNAIEMTYPEDLPMVLAELTALLADPARVSTLQYRFRHKNGEWRWIESTFSNLLAVPSVTAIIINFRDIHERKLAEDALRKSQELLTEAQRIGRIGHMEWNSRAQVLSCSEQVYDTLGLPRAAVITQNTIASLMAPGERERVRQLDLRAIQQRTDMDYEYRLQMQDGSERWLHQVNQVTYDENGAPVRTMVIVQDVTERKRTELALRESEERFRSLFESSNAIMLLIEPDSGRIVDANHAAAMFYGYSRQQLESMNIADINQISPKKILEERQKAKREERNYFVFPHRLADGRVRTVEVRSHPIQNDRQTLLFSIIYDITESVQNERELRQSQLRSEMALRGANAATWDWNVQTGETVFDERWAEIVGYSLQELAPISIQTWADLCHPDDLKISDELLQKHFAGETAFYECEARMKHKNGSWVWVLDRGKVLEWDADGKPVRMLGTHLDTTGRKQAEIALRASEEKYRGLLESLDSEIVTLDANGTILYVNDMAASSLGGSPAALVGKTMGDLLPSGYAVHYLDIIRQVIRADRARVVETQNLVRGRQRWYRTTIQPIHDESGQAAHVLINAMDIDDLKTAQHALEVLNRTLEEKVRQRTAEVQDLYDHAPVGYHSLDAGGYLSAINETELQMLGYSRDELLRQPATRLFTAESAPLLAAAFRRLATDGKPVDLEVVARRKDGRTFPVMLNALAIYDAAGRFVSSRSTLTDITERKRAEDELKRNVNFINVLLDAIPTPVFYKDKDGRYQGCNRAFSEVMGKTAEEIRGKAVHQLWPSAQAEIYHQKDVELIQNRARQVYESSITDKEGGVRPVIFVKNIFLDETGHTAGMVGAFLDITERKQAEAVLRESEAQNRLLFEESPDAVVLFDEMGRAVRVNRAWEALSGLARASVLGRRLDELNLVSPEDLVRTTEALIQADERRTESAAVEFTLSRPGGDVRQVDARMFTLDLAGRRHYLATVRDITAEQQAAEALRRALDQERELNELKSRFISMTSHEFRTPLTVILSSTELLELYGARWPDEKKLVHYRRIKSAVQNMTRLLEDVLILGRVEAGRLTFSPAPLDLAQFCRGMMEELQLGAGAGHTLEFTYEGDGGPVRMDEKLLRQILGNLLSNAIKYSPDGGRVKPSVRLAVRCAGGQATFEVADQGIGIPADAQARLFETFHRAQNVGAIPGTGLGLAIVKASVELHRGTITCASAVGQGTTFTVTLPTDQGETD